MAKFKLKKRRVTYKMQVYHLGDILEMKEFDNALPRAWFEEVKEMNEVKEKSKPFAKRAKSAKDNMEEL